MGPGPRQTDRRGRSDDSSRIGRPSKKHSRISRDPRRSAPGREAGAELWGVIPSLAWSATDGPGAGCGNDVAGVAGESPALERPDDGVAVRDLRRGRRSPGRRPFQLAMSAASDQIFSLGGQRAVYRHGVADPDNVHHVRMPGHVQRLLDLRRQRWRSVYAGARRTASASKLGHADAPRRHRAHVHAFEVVGSTDAVGEFQVALTRARNRNCRHLRRARS